MDKGIFIALSLPLLILYFFVFLSFVKGGHSVGYEEYAKCRIEAIKECKKTNMKDCEFAGIKECR